MSRRWPGWEDLHGIEVAGGANAARKQGRDYVVMRVIAGPEGVHGPLDNYPIAFHADGHVSVLGAEDLACVVDEDGMLTGIEWTGSDEPVHTLVKPLYVQVPSGDALPFLHHYSAGEMVSGTFQNDIDAAIDTSPNADGSFPCSLTITMCKSEDMVVACGWPLTPESASAVAGLMRERHGEPVTDVMTSPGVIHEAHHRLVDDAATVVTYQGGAGIDPGCDHEHDPE